MSSGTLLRGDGIWSLGSCDGDSDDSSICSIELVGGGCSWSANLAMGAWSSGRLSARLNRRVR
jgi:hypothetical protein